MPISIVITEADFERAPLAQPFGFKGSYVTELWQTVVRLTDETGPSAAGPGTQSVLWSDSRVFADRSEAGGNTLMFAVTEYALSLVRGRSFVTPTDLLDAIYGPAHEYACLIAGRPDLRPTFTLNALVPIDLAAWTLYARRHALHRFDDLVPPAARPALRHRAERLFVAPVVSYATSDDELRALLDAGHFVFKIKLGAPGSQAEMLARDIERLAHLHRRFAPRETPHTASGRLAYYLDANGRYERKETVLAFLDAADRMGALERIVLLEEPFPEESEEEVGDLGICVAADESAHTDEDARRRIDLGYGAIALKPVAKTLSMTFRILEGAHAHGVPCFCADLTVNPWLLEWNKAVAARVAPLPGFAAPFLEVNGPQNYRDWEVMSRRLPPAPWRAIAGGAFRLGEGYYAASGEVFAFTK
jgi:L-alanine-DL-glutamate epimerase-like enolase superfamily enzyme